MFAKCRAPAIEIQRDKDKERALKSVKRGWEERMREKAKKTYEKREGERGF